MKKSKIPTFKSYKEEAEFWDTHDITDFLDELMPVSLKDRDTEDKNEFLSIRVTPELKKRVERRAKNYSISPSSLVRMWMVEKLKSA